MIQAKLRKNGYQSTSIHSYLYDINRVVVAFMTDRDHIFKALRRFKNENAEKYGIESIVLFGSVARGEHNEDSDVNLLIKFKFPSLYLYSELSDALESLLGRKVDIVTGNARKRPWFSEEISKDLVSL